MDQLGNSRCSSMIGGMVDLCVTLVLWTYFTLGFLFFFLIFYLLAYLFVRDYETVFQKLNHIFYKGFLGLLKTLIPRNSWRTNDNVIAIRSSIIVCNHVSYLDPLIMIALFSRHKTIVKTRFFKTPIFGWFLKNSGYIPDTSEGPFAQMMIEQVTNLPGFLTGGGNLFVFPEGTRRSDGQAALFNKGAFKIARLCQAPIHVVHISNTNLLFPPGRFLFNSRVRNRISVDFRGTVAAGSQERQISVSEMMNRVRTLLASQN